MGTRSLVTFNDEFNGKEICVVYRQYDGYPDGRGKELADFLEGYVVGNGIPYGVKLPAKYANGMRELSALWVVFEKSQNMQGNVYLEPAKTRDVGEEWIYEVSLAEGNLEIKVTDVLAKEANDDPVEMRWDWEGRKWFPVESKTQEGLTSTM